MVVGQDLANDALVSHAMILLVKRCFKNQQEQFMVNLNILPIWSSHQCNTKLRINIRIV